MLKNETQKNSDGAKKLREQLAELKEETEILRDVKQEHETNCIVLKTRNHKLNNEISSLKKEVNEFRDYEREIEDAIGNFVIV